MFRSPASRFTLRVGVVATLAGLATLRASIGDGIDAEEWVALAENTLAAGAAYAGIGAAFGAVEPFVGNKKDDAQVPVPPADPVRPEAIQ